MGCASTHTGYVTEQINGVTHLGPEIEKKKKKKKSLQTVSVFINFILLPPIINYKA